MSIKQILKNKAENIPYSIGAKLALIPYSFRLGSEYSSFRKLMESKTIIEEQYIIERFSKIFEYAKNTFPFYKRLYQKTDVLDLKIKSIKDIEKIPVITKEDIRNHLDDFSGAMLLNTGGTSGEPFSFFVDKNAFAREWAHMHYIWSLKNYSYTDLKVTLRGKDLGNDNIKYNPVH